MPRLRPNTMSDLRASGERVEVVSRASAATLPFVPQERVLIRLVFLLATVVDTSRDLADHGRSYYEGRSEYWREKEQLWRVELDLAWDLLRAVRSGRFEWDGTAEFMPQLPESLRGKVAWVMSDGKPHTAAEIAERFDAKLSTVRQYLWEMTSGDLGNRLDTPGWFQVKQNR